MQNRLTCYLKSVPFQFSFKKCKQLVPCYIFGRDLLSSDTLVQASMSPKTSSNTLKGVKYSTGKVTDSFSDIWENEGRATLNSEGKNEERGKHKGKGNFMHSCLSSCCYLITLAVIYTTRACTTVARYHWSCTSSFMLISKEINKGKHTSIHFDYIFKRIGSTLCPGYPNLLFRGQL